MNPYDELGISSNTNSDDIKKAYKKMANKHHPDIGCNKYDFLKIQLAYDTLSDEDKKHHYDTTGEVKYGVNNDVMKVLTQISIMILNLIDIDTVNVDNTDLLDVIKRRINDNIVASKIEINKLQKRIKKRKKTIKNIFKKNKDMDNDNLLIVILNGDTDNLQSNIGRIESGITELNLMLSVLDEYGYNLPTPPVTTNVINTTATYYISNSTS